MKRRSHEVNGCGTNESDPSRSRPIAATILAALTLTALACGGSERKAERLYREASRLVERGEYARAVERLDAIVRDYPDAGIADRARREAVVYRGLSEAVIEYPVRRSLDAIIQVARALDRYRGARGGWPESLEDLVPGLIDSLPQDGWGRALRYDRRGKGYRLVCLGSDDAPGGEGDASDIVVESGSFVTGAPR